MQIQLLLADHCPTCLETRRVWQQVCRERGQSLEVLFTDTDVGHKIVERMDLQMFPALVAGGRVCAVGAPSEGVARDTLARVLLKRYAAPG